MSWTNAQYDFSPYNLEAVKKDEHTLLETKEQALEAQAQRRAGRHKRVSVLCQVPDCGMELISEKTYYKRYRICVEHCNAATLIVEGRRQRFCQQCGRFHDLTEFDGNRKSCRYKLKRHNERRRGSTAKGRKLESEDEDEAYSNDESELHVMANIHRKSTRARAASKKLHLWSEVSSGGSEEGTPSDSFAPSTKKSTPPRAFCDAANSLQGQEASLTDRLLSATRGTLNAFHIRQASEDGVCGPAIGYTPGSAPSPQRRSIGSRSDVAGATSIGMQGPLGSTSLSNGTDFLDCIDEFVTASAAAEMSPGNDELMALLNDGHRAGSSTSLPLVPLNSVDHTSGVGPSSAVTIAGNRNNSAPAPLGGANGDLLDCMDLELLDFLGDMPLGSDAANAVAMIIEPQPIIAPNPTALPMLPVCAPIQPTYDAAARMTDPFASASWTPFAATTTSSDDRLVRLSMKVFNCTPDVLVPAVRSELESLLCVSNTMAEGYVRPGCTHMTVNMLTDGQMEGMLKHEGLKGFVNAMLRRGQLSATITKHMMVQYDNELVVVKDGAPVAVIDTASSSAMVPRVAAVRPIAVPAGYRTTSFILAGQCISDSTDLVLCRQHGRNLTVAPKTLKLASNKAGIEIVDAKILGLAPGFADVEVQRAGLLGAARPVVVLRDSKAVAEIRQLEKDTSGVGNVDDFMRRLGLVVQFLDREAAVAEGRAVPQYTDTLVAKLAAIARKLCVVCAGRGWSNTLAMLLPAITADGATAADALAAMNAVCPPGMSFLHVVVGRGNADLLRCVATWGAAVGLEWQIDGRGANGVTPLHLVAMFNNSYELKRVMKTMCSQVDKLWGVVQADDGTTPEALQETLAGGGVVGNNCEGSSKGGNHYMGAHHHRHHVPTTAAEALKAHLAGGGAVSSVLPGTPSSLPLRSAAPAGRLTSKARASAKLRLISAHMDSMAEAVRELEALGVSGNKNESGSGSGNGRVVNKAVASQPIGGLIGAGLALAGATATATAMSNLSH